MRGILEEHHRHRHHHRRHRHPSQHLAFYVRQHQQVAKCIACQIVYVSVATRVLDGPELGGYQDGFGNLWRWCICDVVALWPLPWQMHPNPNPHYFMAFCCPFLVISALSTRPFPPSMQMQVPSTRFLRSKTLYGLTLLCPQNRRRTALCCAVLELKWELMIDLTSFTLLGREIAVKV